MGNRKKGNAESESLEKLGVVPFTSTTMNLKSATPQKKTKTRVSGSKNNGITIEEMTLFFDKNENLIYRKK